MAAAASRVSNNIEIDHDAAFGWLVAYIRSSENPKVKYRIGVRSEDGMVECACPDFQKRRKHYLPDIESAHVCKHVAGFRKTLQSELEHLRRRMRKAGAR